MWNNIRDHLHSFIFRLFAIYTIFSLSSSVAFASTVGQLNSNVSFDFMNIASFKASSNAYFSNVTATPEYMATSSILGSFINTFGPWYSYKIQSGSSGTPATYFETKDVNRHLQDISINQWFIDEDLRKFYDRYYTYSDGNAALLNNINTQAVNIYGSTSASNVQLASLNRKFTDSLWLDTDVSVYLYNSLGGSVINPTVGVSQSTPFYFRFYSIRNYDTDLFRIILPIQTTSSGYLNKDDAFTIEFKYDFSPFNNMDIDYTLNKTVNTSYIDLTFKAPPYGGFYLVVTPNYPMQFRSDKLLSPQYMNIDSLGYLLKIIDYDIINKDNQSDIVQAINDKVIDIDESNINITGVVPIINTVVDKDVKLTVPITDNDLDDVSDTVNTLDNWTNTGVSISDALDGINDMLNVFFTSENKQITETISNGYTDYYN